MSAFVEFVNSSDPCPHCLDEGTVCMPEMSELEKEDCAYCFCTPAHGTGLFICMCCHESVCEEHIAKHRANHNNGHALYTKISRLPPRLTDEDVIDALVAASKDKSDGEAATVKNLRQSLLNKVHMDGKSEGPAYDYRVVCFDCSLCFPSAVSTPDVECAPQREGVFVSAFGLVNATLKAIARAASVAGPAVKSDSYVTPILDYDILTTPEKAALKTSSRGYDHSDFLIAPPDYRAICDVGEDGKSTLKPAFGANALTGMHNFGNTCYLASAMQVLISTSPDFRRAFLDGKHIQGCTSKAPRDCFGCQLEKFATAVYSDRFSRTSVQIANSYDTSRGISVQSASAQELAFKRFESAVAEELKALSNTNAEGRKPLCVTLKSSSRPRQAKLSSDIVNGVTPRDLKRVLANGRSDFLSGDQQDAQEFIAHVLALSRAKVVGTGATRTAGGKSEREDDAHVNGGRIDPSHSSRIEVVARKECLGCQRVAYARNLEDTIRLSNPIDPSSLPAPPANKDDPEPPRPSVALQEVFERFVSPSMVEGARCEDCSARDGFITTNCLANLPEVLVFDVNRQYFDVNTLSTKKMNVLVMPPQSVDLSFLKGPNGPQPGEQTLSSHSNIVRATTDAIYADVPPTATSTATTASAAPAAVVSVDEMSLVQMISMGIDQPVAEWALRKTKNNLEQAIDAVFSGAAPSVEELLMQSTAPPPPPATPALTPANPSATADSGNEDGSVTLSDVAHGGTTTYHLSAMISHVGSSAQTGHYVCHIRKPKSSVTSEAFDSADSGDDDHCWVSYNDEKIGVTTRPPFGQASTYVYSRTL